MYRLAQVFYKLFVCLSIVCGWFSANVWPASGRGQANLLASPPSTVHLPLNGRPSSKTSFVPVFQNDLLCRFWRARQLARITNVSPVNFWFWEANKGYRDGHIDNSHILYGVFYLIWQLGEVMKNSKNPKFFCSKAIFNHQTKLVSIP